MTLSRQQLRKQLRARRNQLSRQQQQQAAINLKNLVLRSGLLNRYRDIALYIASDGEIDPAPLMAMLERLNKRCYLPVLAPDNKLWFVRYQAGEVMRRNRFRIPEPNNRSQRRQPWSLGLIFLPLVGFDSRGGRLGMGGGFYDRTLSGITKHPKMRRPQLVGLAHHCQQVDELSLASWDIPLNRIVTDQAVLTCQ